MIDREIVHNTIVTQRVFGARAAATLAVRAAASVAIKWLLPRQHICIDANSDIELRVDGPTKRSISAREALISRVSGAAAGDAS